MQEIGIEYEQIVDSISGLKNLCIRLSEALSDLYEKTEKLDIFWDGDSNAAFICRINDDLAFMNLVLLEIKECIELADEVVEGYQETEKVIDRIVDELELLRI